MGDGVPAGFEALMDAQTLVVEVRFNERKVGTALVTADADTLSFEEPDKVVALLPGIKDADALTELLKISYPTNGHLVCFSKDEPAGCGQIDPEPVAIIYNSSILLLDIYIGQSLQDVQSADGARYLPPPDERISSILSIDTIISNTSDGANSLDLATRALSSYGSGNLMAEADFNTRTDQTRLRTARVTHLFRDHSLTAGSYIFESGSTLNNLDILGANFESSLRTRVDLDDAFSTELAIFLPRRAQVQMIVDERAYVSESYAAGNQALNTRSLPSGTYEVEIRVFDPVSGVRSETRLFTKSTSIPPRGETVFGLTFGIPLVFEDGDVIPELTDISLGSLNIARRFTDHTAWNLNIMGVNSVALAEAQYLFLGPNLSMQFSLGAGSEQIRSGTFRLGYTNSIMSLSLSSTWFRANDSLVNEETLESVIPDEFTQHSVSWTRSYEQTALNARYSRRTVGSTRETERTIEDINIVLRHLIFRVGTLRTNLEVSLNQNNEGRTYGIGIVMAVDEPRARSDLGLHVTQFPEGEDEIIGSINHNLLADIENPIRWETTLRSELEKNREGLGLSGSIEDENYGISFNSDWNSINAKQSTRNTAFRFSTQLGIDDRGFAMGGTDVGQSGVILDVVGVQQDLEYDFFINGIRSGVGRVGRTRFIGLPPLREYTIKLVPRSNLTSGLTEDTFRFSVFPGTIYRIDAEFRVRALLVATIVDENGEPVRNAFVNRVSDPALIDADGFFSAEVSPRELLRVARTGLPDCIITAPQISTEESMLIVDEPLICVAER